MSSVKKREVCLALNICTYHREDYIYRNLEMLQNSLFFDKKCKEYYGRLHIFIIDNAQELQLKENAYTHLVYNENTGGSGGFQRGIEEIRKNDQTFTHVIFMDDDVVFDIDTFYDLRVKTTS